MAAVPKLGSLGCIHSLTPLLEARTMIIGTVAFWFVESLTGHSLWPGLDFALGVLESTVIIMRNAWTCKAKVGRARKKKVSHLGGGA